MGTHPIFESDFDCLTDMAQGNRLFRKRNLQSPKEVSKRNKAELKKGSKKQVKPKKTDQIISKGVQKNLTKVINKNIERECLTQAGKAGTSLKVIKPIKTDKDGREIKD